MRNIYTGIDLGSDSIKIVVAEFTNGDFHVLAQTSVSSVGLRRGLVVNHVMATTSLNQALEKIESILGYRTSKAVITVPSNDTSVQVVEGEIKIEGEVVQGTDISNLLHDLAIKNTNDETEVVSILPIIFTVDGKNRKNPNRLKGEILSTKAAFITTPKRQIYDYLKVFHAAGVEVEDITFNSIGDYFKLNDKNNDEKLGAIVNIGHEKTEISIFNKGVLIKNSIINLGGKNIDKDLSYIYGLDLNTSREIKEKFACASVRFADQNDILEFLDETDQKKIITQYELAEVIEARVNELLQLITNEINSLTNRKISYIIVTGGTTELYGFNYVVENVLGPKANVMKIMDIGIRHNKFSSSMGIIEYFHDKMKLREKEVTHISEEEQRAINEDKRSMLDLTEDISVSKIFGYFTDTKGGQYK